MDRPTSSNTLVERQEREEAPTGADRLVETLEILGVEVVFGLPGVHNLPIWRSLAGSSIRLVLSHHEQAAAYAADGYARASGRLGVCIVTSGPGAANTLGAVGEAMASGSPVLAIATDIPSSLRKDGVYRGVLHETRDQAAMFAPVVKHSKTLTPEDDIGAALVAASELACGPPSGPVYIGVPTDMLSDPAVVSPPDKAPKEEVPFPTDAEFARALALIRRARLPLIWAGGGALRSGAGPAISQLAARCAAPVLTTYMGRGILPPGHPCLVGGNALVRRVGDLWDEADLVIAIGTDFDGTMTQNWQMPPPRTLISINIDPLEATKNYYSHVTLVGDANPVTEVLADRLEPRAGIRSLGERLREIEDATRQLLVETDPQAVAFLDAMTRVLPPDTVLMLDMCIPAYWLASFYPVPAPRHQHYPVGWGTLGFAFPASIGASVAASGRVVCVTGDGGFLFSPGELATLAAEKLPVTVVLVDDGGYGMLRFDQRHAGEEPYGVDWSSPDFAALVRAFDIPAQVVQGFDADFEEHLRAYIASDGPNVLVIKAALCPPPTTFPYWYRQTQVDADQSAPQTSGSSSTATEP